jgi:hypothetical protein
MTHTADAPPKWARRQADKRDRLAGVATYVDGKVIDPSRLWDTLEGLLRSGDRVAPEGDNQKQADFLPRTLAQCDPGKVNGLHMLISSVSRPEHLDLFEQRIAAKLDFAYSGPQSVRIAQLMEGGQVRVGAIHTYVELYARMLTDLTPNVALLCATKADRDANSSTVTEGRLPGFGGAPNMGHDPHGRRHPSPAWLSLIHGEDEAVRGRKLVVQIAQTFQKGGRLTVSSPPGWNLRASSRRPTTASSSPVEASTGVRSSSRQSNNLGLNAVAEICSALLDLRQLAPVIGVQAGEVGCYGGVSIAAGLCTRLIVTPQARIGLNGAAVIEQEAGVEEFDSSDRALIWRTHRRDRLGDQSRYRRRDVSGGRSGSGQPSAPTPALPPSVSPTTDSPRSPPGCAGSDTCLGVELSYDHCGWLGGGVERAGARRGGLWHGAGGSPLAGLGRRHARAGSVDLADIRARGARGGPGRAACGLGRGWLGDAGQAAWYGTWRARRGGAVAAVAQPPGRTQRACLRGALIAHLAPTSPAGFAAVGRARQRGGGNRGGDRRPSHRVALPGRGGLADPWNDRRLLRSRVGDLDHRARCCGPGHWLVTGKYRGPHPFPPGRFRAVRSGTSGARQRLDAVRGTHGGCRECRAAPWPGVVVERIGASAGGSSLFHVGLVIK